MSTIEGLVSKAILAGGDSLEVRYKDRHEEVLLNHGSLGIGLCQLESSSPEAKALREDLYKLAKAKRRVTVNGQEYEFRSRIFDSFGEHAFRVEWKPIGAGGRVAR